MSRNINHVRCHCGAIRERRQPCNRCNSIQATSARRVALMAVTPHGLRHPGTKHQEPVGIAAPKAVPVVSGMEMGDVFGAGDIVETSGGKRFTVAGIGTRGDVGRNGELWVIEPGKPNPIQPDGAWLWVTASKLKLISRAGSAGNGERKAGEFRVGDRVNDKEYGRSTMTVVGLGMRHDCGADNDSIVWCNDPDNRNPYQPDGAFFWYPEGLELVP